MTNYPSRKVSTRKKRIRTKKKKLYIIANFWLLYLIFLTFIPMTNDTYSYFNDTETISNSILVSDNFCADEIYAANHEKECRCKDNSGIGNGPEPCDGEGEKGTDPDNPKHGDHDDHPKTPKEKDSMDTEIVENQTSTEKITDDKGPTTEVPNNSSNKESDSLDEVTDSNNQ